ncbi:hypothetical protein GC176_26945 [bacterium]|nr:hypothetical protein [bacterium]
MGVDAHPLIREYFAEQLRQQHPAAFRAAHSRLFDHLRDTTAEFPDTLEGLQPLYQAVTHGCLADRHQEACDKVYRDRIQRSGDAFSTKKLGAIGADLGAVASFFESPLAAAVSASERSLASLAAQRSRLPPPRPRPPRRSPRADARRDGTTN